MAIVNPLDEYLIREYPRGAVRLDLNESPYPPSGDVVASMVKELGRVNRYPEARLIEEARGALAWYSGIDPVMVALTGGGDYGLLTILALLKGRWSRVVVPEYTYSMTPHLAGALGLRIVRVPMVEADWWGIDESILFEEASVGGILIIDTPNNPTGSRLLSVKRIVELAEEARGPVIVDEAYYDFDRETVAPYTESHPNLVVLRTMSKAFSLAGMRVGYIIAERRIAATLRAVAPFPVSRPALAAVKALIERSGHVRRVVEAIEAERGRVAGRLRNLGLRVYNSRTNFLLVDTPISKPYKELEKHLVYVKKTPIRDTMMRTSIGAPTDNDKLITAIQQILEQQAGNPAGDT